MELEMIECPRCGKPFPKLRKEKFGYNFCIDCSLVEPKVGIVTVNGEGDHTWNDILVLDKADAVKFEKKVKEVQKIKKDWEIEDTVVDPETEDIEPLSLLKLVHKLDDEDGYESPAELEEEEDEEELEDLTEIEVIEEEDA